MAIFEFLEGWYNTLRRHSALGYLSPNDFERAATTPHASALERETPPSFSTPRASAAMSQNVDSRGTEPPIDILQESTAGLALLQRSPITHPPAKALTCPPNRGSSRVPLGVLRAGFDAPPPPDPEATGPKAREVVSLGRGAARLRPSRPAPARHARGVHHGPRGRLPRSSSTAHTPRTSSCWCVRRSTASSAKTPHPRETRSCDASLTRCTTPRRAAPAPSRSLG